MKSQETSSQGLDATDAKPRLERWQSRTEWPLATVAIIFLGAYSVRVLAEPQGRTETALQLVIWITWAVFLVDYIARLCLATHRARWFLHHILDLAVVALPLLRPLRLLRLVVLIAALQKAIGGAIRGRVVVYTVCGVVLLVYVASLAILDAERYQQDSKITTFGDALWWSITTITTVGYGDLSPVTVYGRVIAVALMIGGISLVGVVTATLASWIVQRVAEEDTAKQAATAAQLDALHSDLENQVQTLSAEIQRLTEAVAEQRIHEAT
ncbi:MAG: two pore domain potassium channel family protein [Mycobacterium sp.]|nr:two pore domain potassium channel family protein [Mycobacterium sp.]